MTNVDTSDLKLPPAVLIYDMRSDIWMTVFDDEDNNNDGSTVVRSLVDNLVAYARRHGPYPTKDGNAEPNVWSPGDETEGYKEYCQIRRVWDPAPSV